MAFSPDGHRIASASADDTVRVRDADTGQPLGPPLIGHTDPCDQLHVLKATILGSRKKNEKPS